MQTHKHLAYRAGADVAVTLLIAGLAVTLLIAGSAIRSRWPWSQMPDGRQGLEALLGLAASVLGLTLLLWWCLGLVIALTSGLLSRGGHPEAGRRLGSWSPGFMRRLVMVVLSLNLVSLPAAVGDSPAVSMAAPAGMEATSTTPPGQHQQAPIEPRWKPQRPPIDGAPLFGPSSRDGRDDACPGSSETVAVAAGDTLWSIASEHLGPYATDVEVAAEWPRWYAANKHIIGPDPGYLLPGQLLQPPGAP